MRKLLSLMTGVILAAVALTGCTSSGIEASRHTLYDTLEGIAGDSSAVLVVEIISQEVVEGEPDSTVSTARIVDAFSPAGLASSLTEEAIARAGDVTSLSEVTVRQLGTSSMTTTPAPILAVGKQYLLFLTPTMLEGDGPADFYVTGGDAGIYDVAGGEFSHPNFSQGDKLPTVLQSNDLEVR